MPDLMTAQTPRELAHALIYPYVERGDPVIWLAHGNLGASFLTYSVHIGGWLPVGKSYKKLTCWQIGVARVADMPCSVVFSLQEIYDEVKVEIATGVTQLSLF